MKQPPFKMKPPRRAVLTRNGRFVVGGRASFVWECFLVQRASGVPGEYAIRLEEGAKDHPWHPLVWSIEDADAYLAAKSSRTALIRKARYTRSYRQETGRPVG